MTNTEDKAHKLSDTITAVAVVVPKNPKDPTVLAAFVHELQEQKVKVGGLLQDMKRDDKGRPTSLHAIEIDTGRRISLKRPDSEIREPSDCVLQPSALTESSEALRRAIRERTDLIVIEKFGKEECVGRGLMDEILAVIASGIPALILLPQDHIEKWNHFTGGMVEMINFDKAAILKWWDHAANRHQGIG